VARRDLVLLPNKLDFSYRASYAGGETLEDGQRLALSAVGAVPGWLADEDVFKLYELAYFADGPVLEIGTYAGKSAITMALAVRDAGRPGPIVSLDVDAEILGTAATTATACGVGERLVLVRGTAESFLDAAPGFAPSLVFVDGDHSTAGLARDLAALHDRVPSGAVLLLHDYADPENEDAAVPGFGVRQAVERSWVAGECEFGGIFGNCALFRRREPRESALEGEAHVSGPLLLELGREPLASWAHRRIALPLARRFRRGEWKGPDA
jgi:hypothetical protein